MSISEPTAPLENDHEVENLLLNSTLSQNEIEKPLSPILNSSFSRSRKFFGGRNQRKSRVKLSNKFQIEKKEQQNVDKQIQEFNEDSFTLTSTDIDNLERLEEIEKNRKLTYKLIIQKKRNDICENRTIDLNFNKNDLCFKKPISPAPKRKTKSYIQNNSVYKEDKQDQNYQNIFNSNEDVIRKDECFTAILSTTSKPIELPKTSNFQTATGKGIEITPENLQYHSKIFEDILGDSRTQSQRKNKYSYLKKSHCIELDNKNSVQVNKSIVSDGKEITLTQDISDCGFSDTQILCVVDNLLTKINCNSLDIDFRGFSTTDSCESDILRKKLQIIVNEEGFNSILRRKRDVQELEFPPNKKLKIDSSLQYNNDNVKEFTMASGSGFGTFHHKEQELKLGQCSSLSSHKKYNIKDKLKFFDDLIGDYQENKVEGEKNLIRSSTEDVKLSPVKKVKVESTFKSSSLNVGFSKASGQKINPHLSKTNSIFADIDLSDLKNVNLFDNEKSALENISNPVNLGFSSASSHILQVTPNAQKSELEYITKPVKLESHGFSSASSQALPAKKPSSFLGDEESSKNVQNLSKSNIGKILVEKNSFQTSSITNMRNNTVRNISNSVHQLDNIQNIPEFKNSKCYVPVKDKLKYFDQLIGDDCDFVPKGNSNIPTTNKTSNSNRPFAKQKLEFFDNLLGKDDVPLRNNLNMQQNFGKFASASGKSLKLSSNALKRASTIFDDILDKDLSTSSSFTTPVKNSNDFSTKKAKRKLGVSALKQISIPESDLQKARMLFDEDFTGISPIKPLVPQNFSACQGFSSCSTPLRNTKNSESFNEVNKTIPNETTVGEAETEVFQLRDDRIVIFDKSEATGVVEMIRSFDEEVKRLEERLIVMRKRREATEVLKNEKLDCDKRPKHGVLYRSKKEKNRIALSQFVNGNKPKENADDDLFCITPQSAGDIHFKESSATILTEDGATVLPNLKDLIGISEIENAFTTMPGTDPRLISKNWIRNHYKWIVWKLASYERMFPECFKGALQVEHVIQQLKYRYDREIDKAERPALRKILEKDDAPQKRLILCVSDIKKVGFNSFELELTDGWYGIRTVIDEPLCYQILANRINIGTKLIIYGAELMNCDGCHPLDVTDLTFLKINFNCTRRAKWDTRLGYQKFPGPFPVPVRSVQPNGGTIGCINVCIARSYPFRYLEKSGSKSVWRNRKAEERKSQTWENERYKKFEEIEETVRNEFCSEDSSSRGKNKNTSTDVSGITCPMTLLEIIENSNDPDGVEEQLTSSQKASLLTYKRNMFHRKQQELASKVKSDTEKLKMAMREVASVMKLLVVDLNGSPTKGYNFFLWRPTEWHVQMLKEGTCHSIYNVHPKVNGDLSSNSKTMFKEKPNTDHMSEIFKRKLIAIEALDDLKFSQNFNEFDTVGVVVQIIIETHWQEMWICDASGRLLFVKIFEGTDTCLLLDNLKRGQVISACNLVYLGISDGLVIRRASANHFTVLSAYPKFKHLQDGLENLKMEMPKDFDGVLKDCDDRIERCRLKQSSKMLDETLEDLTLTSSRLTSTDIALSLIDIDKFF